ncbi:MAG: acyltransferase family protein [Lachnospiraceae bacterium]
MDSTMEAARPEKRKRNGRIDLLRFVFALVIMLHHSRYVLGDDNSVFIGGSLAVEFFFLVSGYLMAVSAERANKKGPMSRTGAETWSFLWRKCRGFLPEFWIAWAIGFVFVSFAERYTLLQAFHAFKDEIFEALLLKMTGLYVQGIDGVIWYISAMLVAMAILYPLLRRHQDVTEKIICPLVALLILGYFCQELGHPRNPTKWLGLVYKGLLRGIAEISLGVTLRVFVRHLAPKRPRTWLRVFLEGFEALAVIYLVWYMFDHLPSVQDYFFILLLFVMLMVDFSGHGILTERYEGDRALRVTGALAKYSGALFFSHLYFAQHLNSVLSPDVYSGRMRLLIYVVLSLANAALVCALAGAYRTHRQPIHTALHALLYEDASKKEAK